MGMTVVSKSMETTYGQFVAGKMNDALTLSEDYINKYLPAEEDEDKENGRSWGCKLSYIYTMNFGKLCYKIRGLEFTVKLGLSN